MTSGSGSLSLLLLFTIPLFMEIGSSLIYYVSNNDRNTNRETNRTQAEKVINLQCPVCPE